MKKNLSYWFISGLLLAIVRGPVFYIFLYSKLALLGSWVIIPVFIAISALKLNRDAHFFKRTKEIQGKRNLSFFIF